MMIAAPVFSRDTDIKMLFYIWGIIILLIAAYIFVKGWYKRLK
jgi:hypothetical protein